MFFLKTPPWSSWCVALWRFGGARSVPLQMALFLLRSDSDKACILVCTLGVPSSRPSLVCFSVEGEEGALLVAVSIGDVRLSALYNMCWCAGLFPRASFSPTTLPAQLVLSLIGVVR